MDSVQIDTPAHTYLCTEAALIGAEENGAADRAEAEAWLATWDADGGRANYGACTCDVGLSA